MAELFARTDRGCAAEPKTDRETTAYSSSSGCQHHREAALILLFCEKSVRDTSAGTHRRLTALQALAGAYLLVESAILLRPKRIRKTSRETHLLEEKPPADSRTAGQRQDGGIHLSGIHIQQGRICGPHPEAVVRPSMYPAIRTPVANL